MPRQERPFRYAIACATILTTLCGCGAASQGSFCLLYIPVYTEDADTPETRRQADLNNAVWMELCDQPP